jgi:hypothetical protein
MTLPIRLRLGGSSTFKTRGMRRMAAPFYMYIDGGIPLWPFRSNIFTY